MPNFQVSPSGGTPMEIQADNWLVALGMALDRLGRIASIERLACETLPNGTVIAKDLRGSDRYVVQATEVEDLNDAVRTLDPDVELVEIDAFESWLADIDSAGSPVFASQAALAASQVAVACDSASVLHLDERGLRFVAASGPIAAQLVGRYIPADAGAAGFAVQHRQVMVLYEVGDDPRHFQVIDKETGYQTRNLCCVPVVHQDVVYGVIEVVNFPSGESFHAGTIHRLERISQRLARRLALGRPATRLSDATPAPDDYPEESGDPVTLDDAAFEPISVEDSTLALDGELTDEQRRP